MRIWAIEATYKLVSGKKVKEMLMEGQPRHLCETNCKIWQDTYRGSHKFKVISIIRRFE